MNGFLPQQRWYSTSDPGQRIDHAALKAKALGMSESPPPTTGTKEQPQRPAQTKHWFTLALLLAVWAVIFLPRLGEAGFTNTEGHRAIPGFELLETPDAKWLTPPLFERTYLRKPPGMAWMVVASATIFGPTEFAARLVSALSVLLAAACSAHYARRWFGQRAELAGGLAAGFAGGLAVLLMPVLWIHGRAAELEAPMFAATLLAALCTLDLLLVRSSLRAQVLPAIGVFVGLLALLLIKGPAGLPAVGGAIIAAMIVSRSVRTVLHPVWTASMLGALGVFGIYLYAASQRLPDEAITQSPGEFLWSLDRLGGVALLAPSALLMGLPAMLAMLFPWGPDASSESLAQQERVWPLARGLAWATLLTLAIFVLAGISNPRYSLPALVFVPALVGYVVAGLCAQSMAAKRMRIARWMVLGSPWFLGTMLVVSGVANWGFFEQRSRTESGREVGKQIASLLPPDALVLSDHAIEARPEVLWVIRRAGTRVKWTSLDSPPSEAWLLVRDDSGSREMESVHDGANEKRATAGRWRVHGFEFVLLSPEEG
jgi:4-amino-4-deoxy-L-arabinose transferase-like glycosyltransferase